MEQSEIEKKYLRLDAKRKKATKEFFEFRESVKDICTHSIKVDTFMDRDDGYGKTYSGGYSRWWVERYKYCEICGKDHV